MCDTLYPSASYRKLAALSTTRLALHVDGLNTQVNGTDQSRGTNEHQPVEFRHLTRLMDKPLNNILIMFVSNAYTERQPVHTDCTATVCVRVHHRLDLSCKIEIILSSTIYRSGGFQFLNV